MAECERKYIKASAIYLRINIRRILIAEGKLFYYYFIIAEGKLGKQKEEGEEIEKNSIVYFLVTKWLDAIFIESIRSDNMTSIVI